METIQLQDNISSEQYEMAVRVLEAMNIKVYKKERVPNHVLQEIEKGLEDVKNGNVIPSEIVHKQMREYVQNCLDN